MKKFTIVFFIFFALPNALFAYDQGTTHAALTDEIVDFYNIIYEDKFTPEEKELIVQGSIEEDTSPRYINHFYDPINNQGWSAEHAGEISQDALKLLSKIGLSSRDPVSAKQWATDSNEQQKYALYGGDQSWPTALRLYAEGNKQAAYTALGHTLHLLEDMTVPDHTRNDTHAPAPGDPGSPYEKWAMKFTRNKISITGDLYTKRKNPIMKDSIEAYFDYLANYSNKNFVSKDTMYDKKYNEPLKNNYTDLGDGIYFYKNDEIGQYTLFKQTKGGKYVIEGKDLLGKDDDQGNKPEILDGYWIRLSSQAVLAGAGAVKLFKNQAEALKKELALKQTQ
ncbi:MAG: hypothetical protein HYW78_03230, partial [Parcubacteria group bacterium]|nr:hypothetical protein [Parcubacteria group bacterium]